MKLRGFASLALAASLSLAPYAVSAADEKDKHSVTTQVPTSPPVAGKREYSYTRHGVTISDPWNWLRDQSYPTVDAADVLKYLEAENAWFEARMAPNKELTDQPLDRTSGVEGKSGSVGVGLGGRRLM